MIEIVVTEEKKRLDTIVFEYYGDLSMYDKVISINPHLLNSVILNLGDKVKLPIKEESKKELEGASLWD